MVVFTVGHLHYSHHPLIQLDEPPSLTDTLIPFSAKILDPSHPLLVRSQTLNHINSYHRRAIAASSANHAHTHTHPIHISHPMNRHSAHSTVRISLHQINAMEYEYKIPTSNVYVCLSDVLSVGRRCLRYRICLLYMCDVRALSYGGGLRLLLLMLCCHHRRHCATTAATVGLPSG